jgi:regulator of replication initiation timing
MAHYIQSLHLTNVLDGLRDAYDLCKEHGYSELLPELMQIRRQLLEALHESLNLYGENAELHQQLSDARVEIRRLRSQIAHPAPTVELPAAPRARKLS